MPNLNHCQFIGHLGRDPEVKSTSTGDAVANFSIACTEKWKDKSGQAQEYTEWVRCVAFRRLGEIAGQYLAKGSPVYVQGRMKTRKWQDKDGVDRYTTEIVVDRLQLLGGKSGSGEKKAQAQAEAYSGSDDLDDDIPF